MSWQNPSAFAWLGLVVPLILLYLFRPQPRPRSVTALFLWLQTEPTSQGGRWARRLPLHPLLLLQLGVLLALVAVLAEPSWRAQAGAPEGDRVVIVLDRSASMAAGGAFEAARARIESGLDDLFEGNSQREAMLVAVDREPEVLVPFTSSRQELASALASVSVLDVEDRLEALRPYLVALARDHHAELWLLSDRLPEELRLPGLRASPLREPLANNVGFSSFAVYPPELGGEKRRPLAQMVVENFSESAQRRRLLLERWSAATGTERPEKVWEQPLNLAAGQRQLIEREIPAALLEVNGPTLFQARLEPLGSEPDDDPLPGDNLAYAALAPPRPTRLQIRLEGAQDAPFVLRALEANTPVELQTGASNPGPPVDLLLRYGPGQKATVSSRAVVELPKAEDSEEPLSALRAVPGAPLVSALPGEFWSEQRACLTIELKPDRRQTLLETTDGRPAVVLHLQGGVPTLAFAFPLERSTLPLNASLPVLFGEFLERYQLHPNSEKISTVEGGSRIERPPGPEWRGSLRWSTLLGPPFPAELAGVSSGDERLNRLTRSGVYRLESSNGEGFTVVVNGYFGPESRLPTNQEEFQGPPLLEPGEGLEAAPVATEVDPSTEGVGRGEAPTWRRIVVWPFLLLGLLLLYLEAWVLLRRGRP